MRASYWILFHGSNLSLTHSAILKNTSNLLLKPSLSSIFHGLYMVSIYFTYYTGRVHTEQGKI